MEHEPGKLIREKVRQAEEQAVPWQKERVWQMVSLAGKPAQNHKLFYYAAASMVIAGSIVFYATQLSYQKILRVKILALESAIKSAEQNQHKNKPANVTAIRICRAEDQQHSLFSHGNKLHINVPAVFPALESMRILNPEIIMHSSEIIVSSGAGENVKQVMADSTGLANEEPSVQAIIGYIPKQTGVAVEPTFKAPKFRLFKSHERDSDTSAGEEATLLTARIN